jgi:poly-gamma-glutamate system protein
MPQIKLWIIVVMIVSMVYAIESTPLKIQQSNVSQKYQAIQSTLNAFTAIKNEKIKRFGQSSIDPKLDIKSSGLLGVLLSGITTNTGQLQAKQMSISALWSAIAIDLIDQAKIKEGDCVAVGLSGSFPALNIAVLIALQEKNIKTITISSVASSMWGANDPLFTWLDMENHLYEQGILKHKSIFVTLGGTEDRGKNLTSESLALLRLAMTRNHYTTLEIESIEQSYEKRWDVYQQEAKSCHLSAYVNIGGNAVSAGTLWKKAYEPGLNLKAAVLKSQTPSYSIMHRFAQAKIPVIHFSRLSALAENYGLSANDLIRDEKYLGGIEQMPVKLVYEKKYDFRLLCFGLLLVILSLIYLRKINKEIYLNSQS